MLRAPFRPRAALPEGSYVTADFRHIDARGAVDSDPSLETLETLRQVIRAKLENPPAR